MRSGLVYTIVRVSPWSFQETTEHSQDHVNMLMSHVFIMSFLMEKPSDTLTSRRTSAC